MTTIVHLVRHGVHDQLQGRLCGRTPGVRMGAAGLAQAAAVGRRLADADVRVVYTSPLERTRQTAEAVAAACGAPLAEDEALLEIDFGAWSGLSFGELDGDPHWRDWNARRDEVRAPGGETMNEVGARLERWLRSRAGDGGAVVGVSHGDVIKAAVGLATGLSMRAHHRFEISPGSITTLSVGDDGDLKLQTMNEVPHG